MQSLVIGLSKTRLKESIDYQYHYFSQPCGGDKTNASVIAPLSRIDHRAVGSCQQWLKGPLAAPALRLPAGEQDQRRATSAQNTHSLFALCDVGHPTIIVQFCCRAAGGFSLRIKHRWEPRRGLGGRWNWGTCGNLPS